jgi:hydrogenase maturation factor
MADLAPHCDHTGCITCGDEAIAVEVLRVQAGTGLALCVDAEASQSTVETALVEPVAPGDRLLVHAGTAIARAA